MNKINEINWPRFIFALGPSVAVYFIVFYYLVPLATLIGFSPYPLPYGIPWRALLLVTLGFLAFLITYNLPYGSMLARRLPKIFSGEWSAKRAEMFFLVALLGGLFSKASRIIEGTYAHVDKAQIALLTQAQSLLWILDAVVYIAIAVAFIIYLQNSQFSKKWRWYAWGILAVELLYAIPTCSRAETIAPVVIALIVFAYCREIRLMHFMAILFCLFLVFPFGNACRDPGALERGGVIGGRSNNVQIGNAVGFTTKSFLSRVGQADVVEGIIIHEAPFQWREYIKTFVVAFGPPRIFWPEKPAINADGNEFGKRIGVLDPDNVSTSVGPTIVGDWYVIAGIWGVILGLAAMGFLWRLIYDYLVVHSSAPAALVVYAITWITVMHGMESSLIPVYAGAVKVIIIILAIHYLIKKPKLT